MNNAPVVTNRGNWRTCLKTRVSKALLVLSVTLSSLLLSASTLTLNPVDDGSIYTCAQCNHDPFRGYLLVAGYIVGETKFSIAPLPGSFESALLSVNPYGLPSWAPTINVYGLASTSPTISMFDVTSAPTTFLGIWTLPPGLGYGQDAFFDVTAFLRTVDTPYVAFVLRSVDGPDVLSSTQYNYGHPSQLTITSVPEPGTLVLLLAGIGSRKLLKFRAEKR